MFIPQLSHQQLNEIRENISSPAASQRISDKNYECKYKVSQKTAGTHG